MGYEEYMGPSPALDNLYEKEMDAYRSLVESDVIARLASALARAREKHPNYAVGGLDAWSVIASELFELRHAIYSESDERQKEEAIDVAVTAIRFILGEHKNGVDKVGESG